MRHSLNAAFPFRFRHVRVSPYRCPSDLFRSASDDLQRLAHEQRPGGFGVQAVGEAAVATLSRDV